MPRFGNYGVSFKDVAKVTLGEVFGGAKLKPSEMTKKLWDFVKEKKLATKE